MADFSIAHKITKAHEGNYSNDPKDRGGETIYGIARKKNPNWSGWILVDKYSKDDSGIKAMLNDVEIKKRADNFYKVQYWDALKLDEVKHQKIANELYDSAVNLGVGRVARWLQRVLNVSNRNQIDFKDLQVDGNIGPQTLSVLNNHRDPEAIWKGLNVLQGHAYFVLAEEDKTQERFWLGWFKRVF